MSGSPLLPLLEQPGGCPGCDSGRRRPLHVFPVKHNKRRLTRYHRLALHGCEDCGLVSVHPLPTPADTEAFYRDPGGWQGRLPVEAKVAAALAKRRRVHERHLELLARHAGGSGSGRPRPRALDFGCGIGGWLDALQDAGWETFGIEPGPRSAAIAGRRHRLLAEVPLDPDLDLVVVHHVLEHLVDPGPTIRRLLAALAPGGVVWISVPNLERLGEHLDFNYVWSDKHVCAFTPDCLRSLLAAGQTEVVAHSDEPGFGDPDARVDRLVCIGRRREDAVARPPQPLEAAVRALRAYGDAAFAREQAAARADTARGRRARRLLSRRLARMTAHPR